MKLKDLVDKLIDLQREARNQHRDVALHIDDCARDHDVEDADVRKHGPDQVVIRGKCQARVPGSP